MSHSSLMSTPHNFGKEEARRSTRLERSVPLIVFGQNRMGEPFVERTVSVSVNLHGCRYPSRHDYGVGSWVTLQVVGLNTDPKPPAVRARVRSVHVSHSSRELQQVGVELENPGNVWGIAAPPQDWLPADATATFAAPFATAEAPAPEADLDPAVMSVNVEGPNLEEQLGPVDVEPKLAEVTTFPSPSPVASNPEPPREMEPPKARRVVITPDSLVAALQGKLQQAAEKAAQTAVAKQIDEAVRGALSTIDDLRQSSVRELQELVPKRTGAMALPSNEEFAGRLDTQLGAVASRWQEQLDIYRARTEEMAQRLEKQAAELRSELEKSQQFVQRMTGEIEPQILARLNEAVKQAASTFEGAVARAVDRRYERLLENAQAVTQEVLLKLDARSAEVQALAQSAVNSALGAFQRQTEQHVNSVLMETKERAISSLSSLEAENRAACDARRQALEIEVARAAERSTEQFRKGMKAFLYSCLVAAVSAVDEHTKSTLDGLLKDNGKTLFEASSDSNAQDDREIIPNSDIDPLTH